MERTRTRTRYQAIAVAAACATGLALVSGCASAHGGKKAQQRAEALAAGHAGTPRIKIALITHSGAGRHLLGHRPQGRQGGGGQGQHQPPLLQRPSAANQAHLVQNAIDQKVDGIAVTLAKPDAMKAVVAKAEKAGHPGRRPQLGHRAVLKESALLDLHRPGRDHRRRGGRRRKLNEVGAEERALRHPRAGQRRPWSSAAPGLKKTFDGKIDILYVNGTDMPDGQVHHRRQAPGRPLDRRRRHPRRALRRHRRPGGRRRGQQGEIDTFDLNARSLVNGIKDGTHRLRRRPAAVPPGLRGGRPAVALPATTATSRRRQPAGADRPGSSSTRATSPALAKFAQAGHPVMAMPTAATPADPPPAPAAAPGARLHPDAPLLRRLLGRPELGALVGAIAVFVFFFVVARPFRQRSSLDGHRALPASTIGIMAVPVALLMIGGEFDLSAGVAGHQLGADLARCSATR